jgi:hypothetical protein
MTYEPLPELETITLEDLRDIIKTSGVPRCE